MISSVSVSFEGQVSKKRKLSDVNNVIEVIYMVHLLKSSLQLQIVLTAHVLCGWVIIIKANEGDAKSDLNTTREDLRNVKSQLIEV